MDLVLPTSYELGVSPYDPAGMLASWERTALAPGLSEFCFAHNSLWPHHIILMDYPNGGYSDLRVPTIGLTSWSLAGFVPKVWVRTKFVVDQMYDLSPVQMLDVKLHSGVRADELHKYKWSAFRGLGRAPYNMPEIRALYWRANPMAAQIRGTDFIVGRSALMSYGGEDAEAYLAQEEEEERERRRNRPGER
ncbi:hypothetical protein BPOR_0298g00130 [Botrytis porri]|uniref:Uncharacterized protein n=1 Tax=Botrytis porri TaxID=87229 RepID=A0A4Z1KLZ9_9HELO|nr:hypothetical protein BPOR_0298g00130 [Botrytis porri]